MLEPDLFLGSDKPVMYENCLVEPSIISKSLRWVKRVAQKSWKPAQKTNGWFVFKRAMDLFRGVLDPVLVWLLSHCALLLMKVMCFVNSGLSSWAGPKFLGPYDVLGA